jgi:ketosteroid isomerase-like protein
LFWELAASRPQRDLQKETPMLTAAEVLSAILEKPTDLDHVRALVTDDVTYVSLNYDHPDLTRIMPWCGTHEHAGAGSIVKTFVDVGRYWDVISFEPDAAFGSGEYAAVFGRFTYRSTVMKKQVTSPFAVFAKVKDGRCYYLQFMEDTLATSASFKSGGQWTFRSNPDGGEIAF